MAPDHSFEALGRTFRFKFGFGAICRLERALNKPFGTIIAEMLPGLAFADLEDPAKLEGAMARLRFSHLGALLDAGLGGVGMAVVEELIDELGLEEAIRLVFAGLENDMAKGKPAPKKAGAPRRQRRS